MLDARSGGGCLPACLAMLATRSVTRDAKLFHSVLLFLNCCVTDITSSRTEWYDTLLTSTASQRIMIPAAVSCNGGNTSAESLSADMKARVPSAIATSLCSLVNLWMLSICA